MQKLWQFYEDHKRWGPLSFFLCGFFIDILTLGRADELFTNVQLASFLILAAILIYAELLVRRERWVPKGIVAKLWKFHAEATQFLLGALFSAYTVFYFQSASLQASFAFLMILVSIMLLNEFVDFRLKGFGARLLFFSYCLVSFFIYLVPVLFGKVGPLYFLLSLILATVVYYLFYKGVRRLFVETRSPVLRNVFRLPFYGVLLFFLVAYYSKVIPPVPLSVNYIGIFHEVQKENSSYRLRYSRPSWKFWEKGAQSFIAREGDSIYCFFSVFSPVDFSDQVYIRWSFKNTRGIWERSDAIPIQIVGGRGEGYRGYTYKKNYHPGDWRIEVETEDERELGRIDFSIRSATSEDLQEAREWKELLK